jgi:N-acetylneuraminic acid mutarotase
MTKLLVGLGETYKGITKKVEIIDLESAKTCKNLPDIDFPSTSGGFGLNVFGGLGFQNMPLICTNTSECYSLDRNKWTSSSSTKAERLCGAVSLSPYQTKSYKLFLTGGNTTEVLTEQGWEELPQTIPVEFFDHCAVQFNSSTVMVIGGGNQNYESSSNKTYFFNAENEIWTEGPQLKNERSGHSCGKIRKNSKSQELSIIVAGGGKKYYDWHYKLLSSVEILDPGSNEWRKGPKLPFGIEDAQMVADQNGGAVLVGGSIGAHQYIDTLYQLPHGGEDTEWFEMEQKLETGRKKHVAFLVPDSLVDCS